MPDKSKLIQWQLPMTRMLYALSPVMLAAVYFFGWRVMLVSVVVILAGFCAEYAFARQWGQPVSSSVLVTGLLFSLAIPPSLPIWMTIVGIVFAVVFGKMVFGGFGKNIFNPALVGRVFLFVCFPLYMGAQWAEPISGMAGGLTSFTGDAITSATPLEVLKNGQSLDWLSLFLGRLSGSTGETCAPLILLGGLFLMWKKTADSRLVVSCLAGFLFLQTLLWLLGTAGSIHPAYAVVSGSFLFGLFFFVTEPVSAPKTPAAKWLYGGFIGIMAVLIRTFSAWNEGMMFAILLGNMFAPITDIAVKEFKAKK